MWGNAPRWLCRGCSSKASGVELIKWGRANQIVQSWGVAGQVGQGHRGHGWSRGRVKVDVVNSIGRS